MTLSTTADTMHSAQSSPIPKVGRSRRRNRSYSDAHVHFATAQVSSESETAAFSNKKINDVAYFDDNPTEDAEKELAPTTSQNQHRGNRPRSKSESEPCHHRRIPHKKKYPHHHQNRHHHLNYGRHSPPPLSSSPCCGKMWVRPISARRGGSSGETHHVTTSALGDRHLFALTSSGGSPSQSEPQATSIAPSAVEEAVSVDRSFIKSKTPSVDYSCTGLEDELMMMYTSSSPTPPPTLFGHGNASYSLAHHGHGPSTCAFGESGKPIIRMKNHHEDDLFESEFLPVTPTKSGGVM